MINKHYVARNIMKLIVALLILIASLIFVPVVSGEEIISPQVRCINVEKITIEQISIGSGPEEPHMLMLVTLYALSNFSKLTNGQTDVILSFG